ncbi:MAG: RNA polymerase sigma factor [Phycisphaerae bacterium]|jgi:RNA polymerase sigma-70 factor (ECF subfamily)|nr:MAG: RNA polymerase sigma factor [Phycisphaerae bacterium]
MEWHGRMKDQPSDEQLLTRLSVDPQAVRLLLERHGAYLQGLARSLTRSETEADDAVQETLMALLKARFDGRSSVRTFIVSILIRQAAVLRRKRRGWLRIVPEVEETSDPKTGIQEVDARLDLATMLQKLAPEYREVIVLRELESMTYDEMAGVLGVPKGTVESRLHRAREQLKQIWKHQDETSWKRQ